MITNGTETVIRGTFFDSENSRRIRAKLHAVGGIFIVIDETGATLAGPLPIAQVEVSSRLGNTPRFLRFGSSLLGDNIAGKGVFETENNDGIDTLLNTLDRRHNLAYLLESRWLYVFVGVIVTILCLWGGVRYGIPMLAEKVAFSVPPSLSQQIGNGTLALLDHGPFSPSKLPEEEQERLRARFAPFVAAVKQHDIHIEFRDAEDTLGPNALALPSGTIVFTDQIVHLAENDEELLAILAHEIGHIDRRHALRHVVQSSALGLLAMAVTGDISSIGTAVTALPVVFTELGYSRDFEREADRYAVTMLTRNKVLVGHFADILKRLDSAHRCAEKRTEQEGMESMENADQDCADTDPDPPKWHSYTSTHPPTAERLRILQEMR